MKSMLYAMGTLSSLLELHNSDQDIMGPLSSVLEVHNSDQLIPEATYDVVTQAHKCLGNAYL